MQWFSATDYRRMERRASATLDNAERRRGMCDALFCSARLGVCAVLVLPKERALISSVVTRLPPPPTASSGHPHSFFILPPRPRHIHSTGGTCPRHLLLHLKHHPRRVHSTRHNNMSDSQPPQPRPAPLVIDDERKLEMFKNMDPSRIANIRKVSDHIQACI